MNYKYRPSFRYVKFKLLEISVGKTHACAVSSNFSVASFCSTKLKYGLQTLENYHVSSAG